MNSLRDDTPSEIGGYQVLSARDYKKDTIKDMKTGEVTATGLPASNVLYYDLSDDAWLCVRPSGTEPKIKFYIEVMGEMGCPKCYDAAREEAEKKIEAVIKTLGL